MRRYSKHPQHCLLEGARKQYSGLRCLLHVFGFLFLYWRFKTSIGFWVTVWCSKSFYKALFFDFVWLVLCCQLFAIPGDTCEVNESYATDYLPFREKAQVVLIHFCVQFMKTFLYYKDSIFIVLIITSLIFFILKKVLSKSILEP